MRFKSFEEYEKLDSFLIILKHFKMIQKIIQKLDKSFQFFRIFFNIIEKKEKFTNLGRLLTFSPVLLCTCAISLFQRTGSVTA